MPKGVYRAFREINKMESGPILKNLGRALVLPAAAIALCFAPVASAVYGIYKGFGDAYRVEIKKSVENRLEDVKTYERVTRELLEQSSG